MSDGLQKLLDRARGDLAFFQRLINDPGSAASGFDLTDEEKEVLSRWDKALTTSRDPGRLAAGCGSSPTCTSTCTATCTVTFTSFVRRGEDVAAAHG
jgi:hypothetical protein